MAMHVGIRVNNHEAADSADDENHQTADTVQEQGEVDFQAGHPRQRSRNALARCQMPNLEGGPDEYDKRYDGRQSARPEYLAGMSNDSLHNKSVFSTCVIFPKYMIWHAWSIKNPTYTLT